MRTQTASVYVATVEGTSPFYMRKGEKFDLPVTDFIFDPVATITVEEDPPRTVFVVEVMGREFQLPSDIFDSTQRFTHWCNSVNLSFVGAARDLQGILYLLRTAEVPEWDGTTTIGLHGRSFVLPEGTFGHGSLVYVAHEFGNEWKGATSLELVERGHNTEMWLEHLYDLARLHKPSVMTPLLGWVAAAPFRSRCSKFPILAMSGSSGWGKTTIVETVLKAFGFWMREPSQLPSSTPHAVVGRVTTNNALPVWFDEYRDSVRPDTMDTFENVLRNAYDGGSIPKGGTNRDNVMQVKSFSVRAPIMVTGEESFTETSHRERMIAIDLPKVGRDVDALKRLNEFGLAELQGFGRAYLEWLMSSVDEDVKQPPPVTWRVQYCEDIARWGYKMLCSFLDTYFGDNTASEILPVFNYNKVKREQTEAAKSSPYDELIEAATDAQDDRGPIVWVEDECIYVRLEALYAWNRKSRTDITLPSRKSRDLRIYLQQQYGAREDKNYSSLYFGGTVRAWFYPQPVTSGE